MPTKEAKPNPALERAAVKSQAFYAACEVTPAGNLEVTHEWVAERYAREEELLERLAPYQRLTNVVTFNGLLPAARDAFTDLLAAVDDLNPVVTAAYSPAAGPDSFFAWGAACEIQCDDMAVLEAAAEAAGLTWLGEGQIAATGGLTIEEFKTFRVRGDLTLAPEEPGSRADNDDAGPAPVTEEEINGLFS